MTLPDADPEASWSAELMLATPVDTDHGLPHLSGDWSLEQKLDGFRCLAVRSPGAVHLWSRNHNSLDTRFAPVRGAVAALGVDDCVIDGEVISSGGGAGSFSGIQTSEGDLQFVAFDLLRLLGSDLRALPLRERRQLLAQLLAGAPAGIAVSQPLRGSLGELWQQAEAAGWEGLVAKRQDSAYIGGRSRSWLKLKLRRDTDLVIGGFTDSVADRQGFGALLVGGYTARGLSYAGKVGSGFRQRTLNELSALLRPLVTADCPFIDLAPQRLRMTHWVRPEVVVQVKYGEWTQGGVMRHPVFLQVRTDVAPDQARKPPP